MGGTSTADSKTTTQQLTPDQAKLAGLAAGNYSDFAASQPTLPGAAGVAGFDPLQTEGQNQVLGSVGTAGDIVGSAAKANELTTSGDLLDPSSNPALRATMDAANRPIYENLTQKVLPGIAADASTNGSGGIGANFGGSRQGIAEGLAMEGAGHDIADNNARIATAGYNKGIDALLQGVGQAPGTAGAQTIPGGITSTVGDVKQTQNQNVLNAQNAAQQFAQFLPLLKGQVLAQGAGALPGGSTTSVGTGNSDANVFSQLIGGTAAAGGLAGGAAKLLPLLLGA